MIVSTFGTLSEFYASKETWNNYVERLEFFFLLANDIDRDEKKKAILLSSCGAET